MKKVISLLLIIAMIPVFAACSGGKNAMEYEGYSFSEGMYLYWMKNWKAYYINNYSDVSDTEEFWSAENASGLTNEEYLTQQIETRIKYYLIAQKLFDDYKLTLDKEVKDAIESDINDQIEYYGNKSEFNTALKKDYGINISVLRNIFTAEEKYQKVFNYLYDTASGIKTATPDDIESYYRDNYVRVKYVMFLKDVKYVYDENGKRVTDSTGYYKFDDLTEDEKAEVKANFERVYEDVSSGGDIGQYMKEYMEEFGYDASGYPNGYYISADDYMTHTADVTSAALAMDVGEVRKLETESSYFVIQKFELIDNAYSTVPDSDQFTYIVSYCNNEKFSKEFNIYAENVNMNSEITGKYRISSV